MAGKTEAAGPEVDLSALGRGTYEIPGFGLVVNGKKFDGDDPQAVEKYHAQDHKGAEQATEAMLERDAAIVAVVTADAPADGTPAKE